MKERKGPMKSVQIDVLSDGTEVLISDEKFQTLYFTPEGEDKPTKYGVVLTKEMKAAIQQGWYRLTTRGDR